MNGITVLDVVLFIHPINDVSWRSVKKKGRENVENSEFFKKRKFKLVP